MGPIKLKKWSVNNYINQAQEESQTMKHIKTREVNLLFVTTDIKIE